MARRRTSVADDFVDLVSRLPWWVGVVFAIASYALFHKLAGLPQLPMKPGAMTEQVQRAMLVGASQFLQYIVPFMCAVAALISFVGRRKRAALVDNAAKADDANTLNTITWREFEMLVGEAFRLQGYSVQENEGAGADGGVDLVLCRSGATYLVQCKQWRTAVVDVKVVRELFGVMHDRQAQGGMVITSGRFTQAATDFARGKLLKLIDGKELHQMIRDAKAARASARPATPPPVRTAAAPAASAAPAAPTCPACNAAMVLRTARKGANAGGSFWGCTRYPACKGTRPAN